MTWLSQIRHHLFKIHMQQTGLSDYHVVINTFLKLNLWKLWPKIIHYRSYKNFDGSSRQEVFCKKGILRNFAKFPGKHLCQSLFFNKVAGLRPATLFKRDSGTGVFLSTLRNFYDHLFLQNTSGGCFWKDEWEWIGANYST